MDQTPEMIAANKQLVQQFMFYFVGTVYELEVRCRSIQRVIDKDNKAACLDALMMCGAVMSEPQEQVK